MLGFQGATKLELKILLAFCNRVNSSRRNSLEEAVAIIFVNIGEVDRHVGGVNDRDVNVINGDRRVPWVLPKMVHNFYGNGTSVRYLLRSELIVVKRK